MKISGSAGCLYCIGGNNVWEAARPLVAALGLEIHEYSCDDEFFRDTVPPPGSRVLVYCRWPAIRLLDFVERLRPVERGIECIVARQDGFVAALVRAVKAGAVDVIGPCDEGELLIERLQQPVQHPPAPGGLDEPEAVSQEELAAGLSRTTLVRSVIPVAGNGKSTRNALHRLLPLALAAPRGLTDSECRVLRMLAAGKSRRMMAARMRRTVKTVNGHCASIRRKLQIAGDEDLVLVAKRLVPAP